MAGLSNTLATLTVAGALATGAANASENRFADVVAAGGPQVTDVIRNTASNIHTLAGENPPILLAQASQETDGKIYTAEVIQVDGTKKEVRYTKDAIGIINPPESGEDWKLIDGSPATSNPKLNKGKNRSILAKYDKESQLMYALVDKNDIIGKAKETIKFIISTTKDGKTITKDQLVDGYYSAFILFNTGGDKDKGMLTGLDSIAKVKLGLSNDEINKIRAIQERKALEIWRLTTGALG